MDDMEKYVSGYLAPRLQGDGGWIEFVSFDGAALRVIFRGECSKCLILDRCVDWIRERIKADLGLDVRVEYERRKPYFQNV